MMILALIKLIWICVYVSLAFFVGRCGWRMYRRRFVFPGLGDDPEYLSLCTKAVLLEQNEYGAAFLHRRTVKITTRDRDQLYVAISRTGHKWLQPWTWGSMDMTEAMEWGLDTLHEQYQQWLLDKQHGKELATARREAQRELR